MLAVIAAFATAAAAALQTTPPARLFDVQDNFVDAPTATALVSAIESSSDPELRGRAGSIEINAVLADKFRLLAGLSPAGTTMTIPARRVRPVELESLA